MGDVDAEFERVVDECYDDVFRFALTLAKTEADAVDLTQQAFLKYAHKRHQISNRSRVKSWLFSVLRNEFIDVTRRKTRFPEVELAQHDEPVDAGVETRADGRIALEALQSVPEPHREPLALYYLGGYTYPEIADILQVPVGTVMSRLSRGKKHLRAALDAPASSGAIAG